MTRPMEIRTVECRRARRSRSSRTTGSARSAGRARGTSARTTA